MAIHETAVISPKARLGQGVDVGPYCVIGDGVELGDGCILQHHVSLDGATRIGSGNIFYPFTSVGSRTQDLKYQGEPTHLEIGDNNTFREFCTINRGTAVGERTVIGSNNNFLAYAHVAHNCIVGSHCIFSNNATLGGHVQVEDYAVVGGLAAVHQFCRIGRYAMVGGCTKIVQDVPPFFIADGNPAEVRGVNAVGLQRKGFDEDVVKQLRQAFKMIYNPELNTSQALERLREELGQVAEVQVLIDFITTSQRGIIR